jgi:chromosome segregation ATPase
MKRSRASVLPDSRQQVEDGSNRVKLLWMHLLESQNCLVENEMQLGKACRRVLELESQLSAVTEQAAVTETELRETIERLRESKRELERQLADADHGAMQHGDKLVQQVGYTLAGTDTPPDTSPQMRQGITACVHLTACTHT